MMKPNRRLLLNLGLLLIGAAILAIQFFVVAQEDKERLVLSFALTFVGGLAILVGFIRLIIQVFRPSHPGAKEPIQSPQTTTGSSAPDRV
jgi:uncharacterized membrane protein YgdD (TMEM256/DUF423 family)